MLLCKNGKDINFSSFGQYVSSYHLVSLNDDDTLLVFFKQCLFCLLILLANVLICMFLFHFFRWNLGQTRLVHPWYLAWTKKGKVLFLFSPDWFWVLKGFAGFSKAFLNFSLNIYWISCNNIKMIWCLIALD